jgi:hypothetical protein
MSDINQEKSTLNGENEGLEPSEGKKKLTDTQLRIVQIIVGVLCGITLMLSIFIPSLLTRKDVIEQNSLLNYLFVAVFLAITFGRRRVETHYRLRLGLFSLALIDTIVFTLLLYAIQILNDPQIAMPDVLKIIIIVVGFAALLVLGVILPYLKYRRRVAEGTQPPIRIPEEKKSAEEAKAEEVENRATSLEQKIADMLSEAQQSQPEESSGKSELEQKVADMLSEAEQTPEGGQESPAESAESPKSDSRDSSEGETKSE